MSASTDPDSPFPSPFIFNGFLPTTLVELRMRFYSATIRAKPRWWDKVRDPDIVARWRAEIIAHDADAVARFWGGEARFEVGRGEKQWPRDAITERQIEWVLEELRYEAGRRDAETGIVTTLIPGVYESPCLIPPELNEQLVSGLSALEDVPEEKKDWHPGTDKQVLDLIHPSLYCIRIGETLVRKAPVDPSQLDSTPGVELLTEALYLERRPDLRHPRMEISNAYQWLPTDFAISDAGEATALGYINNLHPTRHHALYPPIAAALARFVPMFERVLGDSRSALARPPVVPVDPYEWYDNLEVPEPDQDEIEENDPDADYEEIYEEWERQHKWPAIPDPGPFAPFEAPPFSLKGRTLQVIVKAANIVLTPDAPTYAGGSWHVEGMLNERIVATGLCYYASSNITESRLAFRTSLSKGHGGRLLPYEQYDERGYIAAFGLANERALNQRLGHVVAEEGKCVAFPNVWQHRVEPFELADKTRPGHRKILCFFVVDPTVRVLSTSDVPPQQAEWALDEAGRAPLMRGLPVELFEMIARETELMVREEAEEHRQWLMDERKSYVRMANEKIYEMEFNMCEH